MSDNNKTYRIKANVNNDTVLNVNLNQDFNIIEMLSLKIDADSIYKYHTSDYGCVAGRVLANGNFGIPNAKISVFIAADSGDTEDEIISYLYPYKTVRSENSKRIRYNLLPEEQLSDCHRNVGSFPSKRKVLDDNNVIEIYDKYYKFTTRSNEAGDYMIFGVPTGNQTLHIDIDLSDIGILSQRPRDMVYKGYNITQFENANMFKKSESLDSLAQIISQNQTVNVYPFWGEETDSNIAITRRDVNINYEFTPTCVFMGSLITDERSNGISKRCIPSERMGKMDRLTTGAGTIEMIRKTQNGGVEEIIVQGNELIDGNGVWCYQIPMNLDYVCTDEYGNIVPTDDPRKGIPTRTKVRFRFSLTEFETENGYSHMAKVLVPNNPRFLNDEERKKAYEKENEPFIKNSQIIDYAFGSETDENSFKDLFWNDVYTVKSYIPRIQMLNIDKNKRFSGIKAVNVNNSNNPIPYNNMRVDLTFMFTLQCAVFKVLLWLVGILNKIYSFLMEGNRCTKAILKAINKDGKCAYIGDGYCPQLEGWYFAPSCNSSKLLKNTHGSLKDDDRDEQSIDYQNKENTSICLTNKIDYFVQCTELALAMEYDVIQFDFYNDWINGMIYMPRWFADIRPKRSYLFGAVKVSPRINACMDSSYNAWFARRYTQQCALEYNLNNDGAIESIKTPKGCKNDKKQVCHKSKGRKFVKVLKNTTPGGGLVHNEPVSNEKYAYYFRPCDWVSKDTKCNYFATDIVLIGSLDETNSQGIPQTFKKLLSSSYQMPDALASTNLGVEGFMYGSGDGTLCSGVMENEGVERKSPTFGSVEEWSQGKDFYESEPYDEDEYPVTEAAGIDWGFYGPNQFTGVDYKKNNLSTLYFPGGHFLGISCTNSETNIKSCINLSRICEMGTFISQRQAIVRKNDNDSYTYSYLIPTGLISGDEINDYGFKNEFATLNYNGLSTKINNDGIVEYDFEALFPINFNGELKSITDDNNKGYNLPDGINDAAEEMRGSNTAFAYRRTLEEKSLDYNRFRLGLHGNENAKNKYLIKSGNRVSLPMYENSFYFYFGLRNGNTALDRFYKEFFAECPALKKYEPVVKITTEKSEYCSNTGKIIIDWKFIDDFKYKVMVNGTTVKGITSAEEQSITIENLDGNLVYDIEIYGSNINTMLKTVSPGVEYPECFNEITFGHNDYEKELSDFDRTGNGCGNIVISGYSINIDSNFVGIIISTPKLTSNNKVVAMGLYRSNSSKINAAISNLGYNRMYIEEMSNKSYNLWAGNQEYEVRYVYECSGRLISSLIDGFIAEMPSDMDIVFNGTLKASYKNIIKPLIESRQATNENWYTVVLMSSTIESSIKYAFKKALFYQEPHPLISSTGSIDYLIENGTPPYTVTLGGYGESVDDESDMPILSMQNFSNEESASAAGYDMSMDNFICPTEDVPTYRQSDYFNDFIKRSDKGNYRLSVRDEAGTLIPSTGAYLSIPSIYRPFFFKAVFISKNNHWQKFRLAVVNGIQENEGDGFILATSFSENEEILTRAEKDYSGKLQTNTNNIEKNYPTITKDVSLDSVIKTGVYSISVKERGSDPVTIKRSVSVNFLGDGYQTYSSKVMYVAFKDKRATRELLSCFIDGKIYPYSPTTKKVDYLEQDTENGLVWSPLTMAQIAYAVKAGESSKFEQITKEDICGDYYVDPDEPVKPNYKKVNKYDYVVGIYDPDNWDTDDGDRLQPRHINTITVIRTYTSSEFQTLMKEFER